MSFNSLITPRNSLMQFPIILNNFISNKIDFRQIQLNGKACNFLNLVYLKGEQYYCFIRYGYCVGYYVYQTAESGIQIKQVRTLDPVL